MPKDDHGPVDCQGFLLEAGQKVAVAMMLNGSGTSTVVIQKVTKITGRRVYLDDSKQPIRYPDRIAIVQIQ